MSNFTTNQFLDDVAGPGIQPVLALFENTGLDGPAYDTVRKWRARDSMPAVWLAKVLLALEMLEGTPMSWAAYFEKEQGQCSKRKPSSSGSRPSVFD